MSRDDLRDFARVATVALLVWLLATIPKALDRLGDRLTAAVSSEAQSRMWDQIQQNREEQAGRMLLFEEQTFDKLEVQELQGEAWWRLVIRQHPELGDKP